jgi:predicted nucleotide-binding protein (sugar kinase/HSP70/actin superfamily)
VAVIGEIFISSEPFTNLDLERRLGRMGVEVINTMGVSAWIREHFLHVVIPLRRRNRAIEAAQEYMHTEDFGGHGIYTVGNAELFSRGGCDGIIQIYPFTCMPEIIAQSSFSHIQNKHGVPIMTLIVDEMTGEAGYMTRLEAFSDMLFMRRERLGGDAAHEPVLDADT